MLPGEALKHPKVEAGESGEGNIRMVKKSQIPSLRL
jgi:hypothetical protein